MPDKSKIEEIAGVSAEAVEKATGRNWQQWVEVLDSLNAARLPHRELSGLLQQEGLESSWWRNKIASVYATLKGKRKPGQSGNMFQAGVRKVFPLPLQEAWDLITSVKATELYAGNLPGTGASNEAEVALNVMKPNSHLRIQWQPQGWGRPSILQVRTIAQGDKTVISFLHAGIPDSSRRNEMKQYWKEVLERLYIFAEKQA